jgi:hypothetical protein
MGEGKGEGDASFITVIYLLITVIYLPVGKTASDPPSFVACNARGPA